MDEKDYEILKLLRENSRMSNMEIARELKVSEGTIRKRIANLYKSGIIKKFTIETPSSVEAMILVRVDPKKAPYVLEKLKNIYHEIYELSGSIDVSIKLSKNTLDEINSEVDNIRSIDGVISTDTMIRLK
ncbi:MULTISPECIES: Lrp/AsnC family transcriptional regulator [Acidiplasma]|jgi:DNA-binding Lrp family transcriptional regulator|uniref:Transcriptional regulator n=2 Tax=Acidiplasma TaxID=507753 RepID=A0A0Q0VJI7_9ARCH|nr:MULTISPECIES: Lrp/AsnC family transcriptional regulator [Acidiplasma]KJE49622.1 transcriptional regulator [Acidiplasma sp. MBA-1]KPV46765.1 transcriptional regulator [Acidiplasma aeolicum]KQB33669.1 transcriptional regulator [Acidiplasma cupricumulans]KQB34229.1 transcriptional regulator [Acidiplasma aeolicum]WMT55828.1 MAG: Lrp/AsnC family transcriptional regulator [Acidiplasma sp.]